MKSLFLSRPLVLLLTLSLGAFVFTAQADTVVQPSGLSPGEHHYWVLAMSYENDFCSLKADRKECQSGFARAGMVLHGLWPNKRNDPKHTYQYCGSLPKETVDPNWCAAAPVDVLAQLSESTRTRLQDVMPGVLSCLQNHEWHAHGTCSGSSAEVYFDQSAQLAARFRGLVRFRELLTASGGKTLTRQDLTQAMAADLGPLAEGSIKYFCRTDKTTSKIYLSEVQVALSRQKILDFPAPSSFEVNEPYVRPDGSSVADVGNCPPQGILITL